MILLSLLLVIWVFRTDVGPNSPMHTTASTSGFGHCAYNRDAIKTLSRTARFHANVLLQYPAADDVDANQCLDSRLE
jgi:hypothetical protein